MKNTQNTEEEWNSLDIAARVNLSEQGFERFLRQKNRLRSEGCLWKDDAEDILTGFIWNEIEPLSEED